MLPTPFPLSADQRQKRSLTQDVISFLNSIIIQYTNPLSFETEPHNIHTIPLVREHWTPTYTTFDRNDTITNSFSIFLHPVLDINTGTNYKTIHPQNITLSIQDVFITYMDKLIEHNENLDTPLYLPSHFESFKENHDFF